MRESRGARNKATERAADKALTSYRKIVNMVSAGELQINGVGINSENFSPDNKVAEFFGLSEDQIEEMKRIGQEHLQKLRDRQTSLAKVQEVSETGIVFDLPADPEFAKMEVAGFIGDLGRAFGTDVAAMLQPSVER